MTDRIERLREIISRVSGEKMRSEANELLDKLVADIATARQDERKRCAKVCRKFDHNSEPRRAGIKYGCAIAIMALGDDDVK